MHPTQGSEPRVSEPRVDPQRSHTVSPVYPAHDIDLLADVRRSNSVSPVADGRWSSRVSPVAELRRSNTVSPVYSVYNPTYPSHDTGLIDTALRSNSVSPVYQTATSQTAGAEVHEPGYLGGLRDYRSGLTPSELSYRRDNEDRSVVDPYLFRQSAMQNGGDSMNPRNSLGIPKLVGTESLQLRGSLGESHASGVDMDSADSKAHEMRVRTRSNTDDNYNVVGLDVLEDPRAAGK